MELSAEKARIFRITHIRNVAWILKNGLHCKNSGRSDPGFVRVGNPELIVMRATRNVPMLPQGPLSDYIPFYFTPFSPMMYNIKTGYRGIERLPNSEIVILVASMRSLMAAGVRAVFTDRHAYLRTANFYSSLDDLDKVDWPLLRSRDFRRDPDDPDKFARYEAEALVHRHLPVDQLTGIVCYRENEKRILEQYGRGAGMEIKIVARPGWYF